MSDIVNVQMGLSRDTIEKIDDLAKALETSNRTDALVRAVRLAHDIVKRMEVGSSVRLHDPDGSVRTLEIKEC